MLKIRILREGLCLNFFLGFLTGVWALGGFRVLEFRIQYGSRKIRMSESIPLCSLYIIVAVLTTTTRIVGTLPQKAQDPLKPKPGTLKPETLNLSRQP